MPDRRTARWVFAGCLVLTVVTLAVSSGAMAASARAQYPTQATQVSRTEAIRQLRIVRTSIDQTLKLIKQGKASEAFAEAKDGYLAHFEYVEVPLRVVDPGLTSEAETKFAEIRGLINSGASTGEIRTSIVELRRMIDSAERRLTDEGITAPSVVVLQAFVIIFLEGLEAVLIVSVLLGYLESVKATQFRKPILWGMALAVVATILTFVLLQTALTRLPGGEELLEAVTGLIAVGMLFYVSFWLIARIEEKRWMEFLRARVWTAVSVGSTAALVLVGFTAIYREGFETALFYQALLSFGPGLGRWVALGLGLGLVALSVVGWFIFKMGRRIPIRAFLTTAVVVLMATSVALLGNAVRELQEVDLISLHRYPDWPPIPIYVAQAIGYWPSRETVTAQVVLIVIYLLGASYLFVIRPNRLRTPNPADPTAVIGRRIDAWCIDLFIYLALMFVILIGLGGESFFYHGDASNRPYPDRYCTAWNEAYDGICVTQRIVDDISGNGTTQATTIEFGLRAFLVVFGPPIAYVIFQGLVGASIGKLALGLRVVRRDGSLAGVGRSAVRTLLWVLDAIVFGFPVVGGVFMLESKGHRRLGDMTAATYVVDKSAVGRPVLLDGELPPVEASPDREDEVGPAAGRNPEAELELELEPAKDPVKVPAAVPRPASC